MLDAEVQKYASRQARPEPAIAQRQSPTTMQSLHDGQQRLEALLGQLLQSRQPNSTGPAYLGRRYSPVFAPGGARNTETPVPPSPVQHCIDDVGLVSGTRRGRQSMDQISARSRQAVAEGERSKGINRTALTAQLRWDMAVHDILSALKQKQVAVDLCIGMLMLMFMCIIEAPAG